ncbi:STAS domain-containing protein [Methylomicrobium sp. RS1]|nr:STAS domain-containing protein [Methylomicrobium sp. RS1]
MTTENDMNLMTDVQEDQSSNSDTECEDAGPGINLDTVLSIQNITELHEKLKNSFALHDSIEINASQVASIDTATLQLLVALKKEAGKQQKNIVVMEPSQRFIESAGLLGLLEVLELDAFAQ